LLEGPIPTTLQMFMRSAFLLLTALASSSLVACMDASPEPVGTDPTSSTATAIVVVERTSGPGDAVRGDAVTARFVRVTQGSVDDSALRMAGIAEDVPAPGACLVPNDGTTSPSIQGRSVELLDVGQVVLASEGSKNTVLLPRSMPDPAGVVSGVLYSSRATDTFAPGSRVSLRSTGGSDLLDGFAVSVTAPRELADVRVSSFSAGLDVAWDAEGADAKDLVYVDLLAPSTTRVVMRCTASEAGRVFVPAVSTPEEGQLAVHRLHRETFKAKGIEPGEIRFDVAKIVAFRK
jgi:hypothetical protein